MFTKLRDYYSGLSKSLLPLLKQIQIWKKKSSRYHLNVGPYFIWLLDSIRIRILAIYLESM